MNNSTLEKEVAKAQAFIDNVNTKLIQEIDLLEDRVEELKKENERLKAELLGQNKAPF